jgi:hypothetical protein
MKKSFEFRSLKCSRGATLNEFLVINFLLLAAILGSVFFQKYGLGRFAGGALGAFGFLVFLALLLLVGDFAFKGIPRLPKCRKGCCRARDYKFTKFQNTYVWESKCGEYYDRRGRKFVFIDKEGKESPHLIWRAFRGWFPDEGSGR